MPLDPIQTTQAITESYLNYLSTTFHLKDVDLQRQFDEALRIPGKFVKGPILEATPPFETGSTIEALIQEGVLSPRFRALRSEKLPLDRPLYRHQEEAIRKAVLHDRNIVVATGTGSGKTEAFLVPILNHLFREDASGGLGHGVRALLLYPMNALANDQMARMRDLLKNYPRITFGRYTGESPKKGEEQKAIEKYRKMFQRDPYPNELLTRKQMRDTPPHILLTNYAMLEYLLLRPDDHVFFDGKYARYWRFLVIDEAHTYTGAKGIEMAMLLRRLKDRVVAGEVGRLQCMITSATLGRGEQDFPEVTTFAQQFFGERIEWVEGDPSRQDVIKATRKRMIGLSQSQWKPDPTLYTRWQKIVRGSSGRECISALIDDGRDAGISEKVLQAAKGASGDKCPLFLYEILRSDERIAALRRSLEAEPRYLSDVAVELFGDIPHAKERLVALVDLAARARPARGDQPLIPARYHLFVRATEGAYLALRPEKRLYLERREQVGVAGQHQYAVFEIAACRQCGATYLVGEEKKVDGKVVLSQPGKQYFEDPGNLDFYLLLDEGIDKVPDNEDEEVGYGEDVELGYRYKLCTDCGAIDKDTLLSPLCGCDASNYINVISVPSKKGKVHKCPACGRQSPANLVWRFSTGKDATASVLATAFYQQIPPRRKEPDEISEEQRTAEDAWSSTAVSQHTAALETGSNGEGRQLLAFSDSRQDAAFFAPYLSHTYLRILRRRLVLETIEEYRESVLEDRWRVQDLINPLQRAADRLGLFSGKSIRERKGEAWKWVLYELVAIDRRNSLEGVGCLGFSLVKPDRWCPPKKLIEDWGLNEDEVWILFQILLDGFRTKGAILFPDHVSPEDEFFYPRNREYYFRGNGSNTRRHISSWNPSRKGVMNARLDFLLRLTQQGLGMPIETCSEVLRQIWSNSLEIHNSTSCWRDLFSAIALPGEGVVYRMKPNFWELRPGSIDPEIEWYYCDACNHLTLLNLKGVCPTYRCDGQLRPRDPAEVFKDNHYRRLYTEIEPIKLVAKEHTAQLTSDAAATLQTQFIRGEVNVLSCSTTFELGVDVGQLESVFMRNVPPSAANYVQRAGRAGRRTSSTAFALTFAQRRSHDLTHFNDPMRMVSGEISAPHFKIANKKIVQRHVYATALAAFWKIHPETFGKVESFFFSDARNGPDLFADYLDGRPADLRTSLQRIVPQELQQRLELDDWGWTDGLFDEEEGVLSRAVDEVTADVEALQRARERLVQQNKPSDFILKRINTIKGRYLINHLSSRNVIPKYGFPVDVVELQIWHHTDAAKRLELDRDLRIALSEYAPSSQVVAGGKLWASRYLKKVPNREWPRYRYAICDHCQCYQRVLPESEETLDTCKACGKPLTGRNRGTFIIPEFGFITSLKAPAKPGEARPERTYTTRTYYSGRSKPGDQIELKLNGVILIATPASDGQLAVINHAGHQRFKICGSCGYALLGSEEAQKPHQTPWRTDCYGTLTPRLSLGHEFKTDILHLRFEGYANAKGKFWLSLLYALLEGASGALDIDRRDLDGCLYPYAGDPSVPALVLFDDVPGGAGHVRRIARDENTLISVLKAALEKLERCDCGGEQRNTSCYGCLRNYRNQFCHDELERGMVIDFFKGLDL